jgi:hypothetical protein
LIEIGAGPEKAHDFRVVFSELKEFNDAMIQTLSNVKELSE